MSEARGLVRTRAGRGGRAMQKILQESRIADAWNQVFTRRQAEQFLELSRATLHRRVESGELVSPHPGIYLPSTGVTDFLPSLLAAAKWLAPHGVVSGPAAGWLHRF